jgi:isoquinoline 1-oxidoreductase subunit alpha
LIAQALSAVSSDKREQRMAFNLNGQNHDIPADWADEPLLFLLREQFGLMGAKFGCGVGICGACTIIIDGVPARACITRAGDVDGLSVRTIEGLAKGDTLHPLQQAWLDHAVPQCGYCQAGQIMAAVALLEQAPDPSADEIDAAMDANLCRCGTYPRIRAAILSAAGAL